MFPSEDRVAGGGTVKNKERLSAPAIGGSSLLVIFGVVCLTVLALLSLSTVLAEKRMAEGAHRGVAAYYEADLEAERIFARLRSGETVPGVVRENWIYRYQCPISAHQTLEVELQKTEAGWTVLRWQAVAHPEAGNEMLPIWKEQS